MIQSSDSGETKTDLKTGDGRMQPLELVRNDEGYTSAPRQSGPLMNASISCTGTQEALWSYRRTMTKSEQPTRRD